VSALTESPGWRDLGVRFAATRGITLTELFAADPDRTGRLTDTVAGVTVDAARTHLTPSIQQDLLALAAQEDVLGWRDRMFAGERVNRSEDRAALHSALRTPELAGVEIDGQRVGDAVEAMHARMSELVDGVREGRLRAADGAPFTGVVHLGIGGSDLGPRLACDALGVSADGAPKLHFVANLDPADRERALRDVDIDRCLVIVASKTFATLETLSNARALFELLAGRFGADAARKHFVAVTARADRAREWGIDDARILPLWDWVGGRFSLWSAIGLPVAFALGMDGFRQLLAGAAEVDRHFRDAPAIDNVPLRLALIGVWYHNFVGADSHLVVPYSERLALLPSYLQQLEMESNGKSVDRTGAPIDYSTAPAVWGQVGTTGQHAFFQWLHQGTRATLCDFVVVRDGTSEAHTGMIANALAQAAALMTGHSAEALRRDGVGESLRAARAMHGNHPVVLFELDGLHPRSLGALIAIHEHRVFCQAMLWRINPFDQWGVERGKLLANRLTPLLQGEPDSEEWDPATRASVARCRRD
jgi:glucose-6-phosphate isomerase